MPTRWMMILVVVAFCRLPCAADEFEEIWRGSFVQPWAVSVNASDGSAWVSDLGEEPSFDGTVTHVSLAGEQLWQGTGLLSPEALSVDQSDGSCWVANSGVGEVLHYSASGATLWSDTTYYGGYAYAPLSMSVNPTDGSVWIGSWIGSPSPLGDLTHRAADGSLLWSTTSFVGCPYVAVSPIDGSVWVADYATDLEGPMHVVHLTSTGTEMWHSDPTLTAARVAVDPSDGSCWVSSLDQALHYSSDHTLLGTIPYFYGTGALSVDPSDGSVWVPDSNGGEVIHFSSDGAVLSRIEGLSSPISVTFSPADSSVWVVEQGSSQVVRFGRPPIFDDVYWGFWADGEIAACVNSGIVNGYEDGTYQPTWPVNRGQMAVYVARALAGGEENVPEPTSDPGFTDVDSMHWAYKYICYAVDQNVVQGYPEGDYKSDQQVTRAQMAVYMARAMVAPTTSVLADYVPADPRNFPDVLNDYWAYSYIEYCVEHGVVNGYLDGTYRPDVAVTRDQMAVYVARAFDLLE